MSMRRHRCTVVLLFLLLFYGLTAGRAEARRWGGGGGGSLGIGVMLGEPTAFTLEAELGFRTALDIYVGFPQLDNQDTLYVGVDYVVKPVDLSRGGSLSVPLYVGIGGAFINVSGNAIFGVRVPFGINLNFRTAPFQIFAEIALRINIVPDTIDRLDVDGGAGFRIFF